MRYQQSFAASEPNKVEFKSHGVVPLDMNGYPLVSTNKLISISCDGQTHFDLI